jgi:hypothetical protein
LADFKTSQESYAPNNRLSFEQYVAMAARLKDRYGVSDSRAMKMVEETQAERQRMLDEAAVSSGSQPWAKLREAQGKVQALVASPPS